LPSVKDVADIVTTRTSGAGVAEVIDRLIAGGLIRPAQRRGN
jgi:hypothetical protein